MLTKFGDTMLRCTGCGATLESDAPNLAWHDGCDATAARVAAEIAARRKAVQTRKAGGSESRETRAGVQTDRGEEN